MDRIGDEQKKGEVDVSAWVVYLCDLEALTQSNKNID